MWVHFVLLYTYYYTVKPFYTESLGANNFYRYKEVELNYIIF